MSLTAEKLRSVEARIYAAVTRAGRNPASVRLVAVSKTVPVEFVMEAVEAGAKILGENRVQEALSKIAAMNRLTAGASGLSEAGLPAPAWHLIGPLQKNKARHAVGEFSLIHSLDSLELAKEIDRQAKKKGIVQRALLEVNIASEETKHGIRPEEAAGFMKEVSGLKNISVIGLMCVPPAVDDPEKSRPYFKEMNRLAAELALEGFEMTELSMGMSQDFEVAVDEGATLVRVGTAIFGKRA